MILIAVAVVEMVVFFGLARLRRRVVGSGPGRVLIVVIAASAVALIVGTVADVSGVALSIPVVVAMVVVVWRSRWRSGDLALVALATGAATAVAYQVAATIDPDTGSYGDQGALALAVVAVVVTTVALVNGWWRLRTRT